MEPTVTHEVAGPDDPIFDGPRIALKRELPTPTPDTSESEGLPSFRELAERPIRPEQLQEG